MLWAGYLYMRVWSNWFRVVGDAHFKSCISFFLLDDNIVNPVFALILNVESIIPRYYSVEKERREI